MNAILTYGIIFVILLVLELVYFKIADKCNIIDKPNEQSSLSTIVLRGGGYHLHKVTERMKKIFYVCCTRAMEQLAVYYDYPSEEVISKAREWFGEDNMIRLPE